MTGWRKLLAWSIALFAPLALRGSAPAQDVIAQGGLLIEMHAGYETNGYSSYCMPVANWSLGRPAAQGGNLEWQLGNNYSIVPVFVSITQRQAIAIKGRVEVTSDEPFHSAEFSDPHSLTVAKEFVAPPGRTTMIALAPRVAPRSNPGGVVTLTVRVYTGSSKQPQFTQQLRSTQLEPAHVYSLLLASDGQLAPPFVSQINRNNELELSLPATLTEGKREPYVGLTTFNHYLLSVGRSCLTQLPLVARDFAFVVVDGTAASQWPKSEQAALASFAVAGGHLCVYNAARATLPALGALSIRPFGRGHLLVTPGGLDSARLMSDRWLSGELEEITIWLQGTVKGKSIERAAFDDGSVLGDGRDRNRLMLDLAKLYAGTSPLTHAAGYIHPIWLYRETCRPGSVEPWDFPEFNYAYQLTRPDTFRSGREPMLQNVNLALANPALPLKVRPLSQLAQSDRGGQPPLIFWIALSALLLTGIPLAAFRFRAELVMGSVLLGIVTVALTNWALSEALPRSNFSLSVIDADTSSSAAISRNVTAVAIWKHEDGVVPSGSILRNVRGSDPGTLLLEESTDGVYQLSLRTPKGFVAVSSEEQMTLEGQPARMWITSHGSQHCLHVDTSGLPPDAAAVLFTPEGVEVVAGGQPDKQLWIRSLPADTHPSARRILAWEEHYAQAAQQPARIRSQQRVSSWEGAPDPLNALRLALNQPDLLGEHTSLQRLGWAGLLQPIGGVTSLLGNQCYLICPLSSEPGAAGFLRLTIGIPQ